MIRQWLKRRKARRAEIERQRVQAEARRLELEWAQRKAAELTRRTDRAVGDQFAMDIRKALGAR